MSSNTAPPSRALRDNASLQGQVAAVLAAVARGVSQDPEALGRMLATVAVPAHAEDDQGASAFPDSPIEIDDDASGVSHGRFTYRQKDKDMPRYFGPYRHRGRWRIVSRVHGKQRVVSSFATEKEAEKELQALRAAAERERGVTVGKAIENHANQLRRNGLKESSVGTATFRLRRLFQPVLSMPLAMVTPAKARELYNALPGAVDTRLNTLALAKAFCRRAKENGWTDTLLLEDVKPEGQRRCGKAKLGLDESRKYLATCLLHATSASPRVRQAAIAAAMPLVFGMRSGEVLGLHVRDLDDGGRILRITAAKTRAGVRSLAVPEWFQPLLLGLTKGLAAEARVFPREKTWLHRHVVNTCKEAGVTRVVPHGLRGTHADLSLVAAATPLQVSQALGHTNSTVTFRHYADKGLAEQMQHKQAVNALAACPTPPN